MGGAPAAARVLPEVMDWAAREFRAAEALVEGERRETFASWAAKSQALATELAERGVGPGDVVALMLPSSIDFAVAYTATLRLGAVVTGLNTRLGQGEVEAVLAQCQPTLVLHDPRAVPTAPSAGSTVMSRSELDEAYRRSPTTSLPPVGPDSPAVIIWTSGTTGAPKGAWFDHRNLASATETAGVLSAWRDRRLSGTPFAHAGYMAKVWDQLATGTTLVVSPTPWRAADMLRLLVDERITIAGGAPTQWEKLLEQPGVDAADLSRLRVGICATAPATADLVREVRRRVGCSLVVRYAMTEAPSITGTEPDDPPEVQEATVGRPQGPMRVAIVDEHGHPAPPGAVGRVQVSGPSVMRGYWEAPELTSQAMVDGWLQSSDLGLVDGRGDLRLMGRSDDMYLRGGYNIYPLEVENVLADHSKVANVGIVGVDAPVIGQMGVAFVVPEDPDDPPTLEQLRELVRSRLADYKVPDRLELLDELPLTSLHKPDKQALRQRLGDQ